jgi:hypothetical protein
MARSVFVEGVSNFESERCFVEVFRRVFYFIFLNSTRRDGVSIYNRVIIECYNTQYFFNVSVCVINSFEEHIFATM